MGPGMGRGRAGGPGMRFGGPGGSPAARLLGLRQQLELTDDQVKRLETLQQASQPKSSETDQLRARADLMDAMKGDGNLTAARAALDKMNRIRTDEQIARMKTQQDARAVLTAAQKTKLDNFRGQMGRAMRDRQGGAGNRQSNRQFMRQRMGRGPQGQGFGPGFAPGARGRMMGPQGMGPRGRQGGMPPMGAQGFRQGPQGGFAPPMGAPRFRRGGEVLPDSSGF